MRSPGVDVPLKCFAKALGKDSRAHWPSQFQRSCSPAERRGQPTRQPQIWESDDVIGMQVREKYRRHFGQRNFQLPESLARAAADIEEQRFAASFDEGTRAETVNEGIREPQLSPGRRSGPHAEYRSPLRVDGGENVVG